MSTQPQQKYLTEIESFREYVLIAQDEPVVQHYVKQPNGSWIYTKIEGLDQTLTFSTLNCQVALKDIYAKAL
jgi:hypothetical protein